MTDWLINLPDNFLPFMYNKRQRCAQLAHRGFPCCRARYDFLFWYIYQKYRTAELIRIYFIFQACRQFPRTGGERQSCIHVLRIWWTHLWDRTQNLRHRYLSLWALSLFLSLSLSPSLWALFLSHTHTHSHIHMNRYNVYINL